MKPVVPFEKSLPDDNGRYQRILPNMERNLPLLQFIPWQKWLYRGKRCTLASTAKKKCHSKNANLFDF
jgi:hypothetical protein